MSRAEVDAARRSTAINIPNVLSVMRLPIAAAFFVVDGLLWRGFLLSLGALTDALDGWLARAFGQSSRAGAILDPVFDKLFVLVALAAFLPGPYLGWVGFGILISRDLYIGLAFLISRIAGLRVPAQVRITGKLVTVLQMATLFVLLLTPSLTSYFIAVVGVAALAAIVDYTTAGLIYVRETGTSA